MTVPLAILAVLIGGLVAGLSVDRTLVALPAWRRVGVEAWAAYSRHADLCRGRVLYPLLGVGGPLVSAATAVSFIAQSGPATAALPVYAAVLLSVGHLLATARAARQMLRVRPTDDRGELDKAFAGFERWQAIRASLQVVSFGANVWALVALLAQ